MSLQRMPLFLGYYPQTAENVISAGVSLFLSFFSFRPPPQGMVPCTKPVVKANNPASQSEFSLRQPTQQMASHQLPHLDVNYISINSHRKFN